MRWLAGIVVAFTLGPGVASAGGVEKLEGYAEWREADVLVVDGQRVVAGPKLKLQAGKLKTLGAIPLGYEVVATGTRNAAGVLVARTVTARENGDALFETDLREEFDKTEAAFRERGEVFEEGDEEEEETLGDLVEEGPDVDRVSTIVEQLMPPYLDAADFRVYVVKNNDWNAFAAPNHSIYVYTGLLKALDDDELAIILGHELVHATHEHSRKSFKKQLPLLLAAAAVGAVAEEVVENEVARAGAQIGAMLVAHILTNGHGRAQEDQADRVGLRYAYEAGFDVSKGPRLWERFADKFGDEGKVVNFFFGDHTQSKQRAAHLRQQIQLNYR